MTSRVPWNLDLTIASSISFTTLLFWFSLAKSGNVIFPYCYLSNLSWKKHLFPSGESRMTLMEDFCAINKTGLVVSEQVSGIWTFSYNITNKAPLNFSFLWPGSSRMLLQLKEHFVFSCWLKFWSLLTILGFWPQQPTYSLLHRFQWYLLGSS